MIQQQDLKVAFVGRAWYDAWILQKANSNRFVCTLSDFCCWLMISWWNVYDVYISNLQCFKSLAYTLTITLMMLVDYPRRQITQTLGIKYLDLGSSVLVDPYAVSCASSSFACLATF